MMECQTRIENDHLTIGLPKDFSSRHYPSFRACFIHHPPSWTYILDCVQLTHLDSAALGMFLLLQKHVAAGRGKISCINCHPHLQNLLDKAQFSHLFQINPMVQPGAHPELPHEAIPRQIATT
ncbi:STAS domain-containing protein [Magnetococcus sp. PR-3]|uniref:STAS domain-containing protein n=1 Tax=Magnetococcus sp. PR-3 TaxID=3120355 RepID=UPI002FCDF034